jgi:hypothetical protein
MKRSFDTIGGDVAVMDAKKAYHVVESEASDDSEASECVAPALLLCFCGCGKKVADNKSAACNYRGGPDARVCERAICLDCYAAAHDSGKYSCGLKEHCQQQAHYPAGFLRRLVRVTCPSHLNTCGVCDKKVCDVCDDRSDVFGCYCTDGFISPCNAPKIVCAECMVECRNCSAKMIVAHSTKSAAGSVLCLRSDCAREVLAREAYEAKRNASAKKADETKK